RSSVGVLAVRGDAAVKVPSPRRVDPHSGVVPNSWTSRITRAPRITGSAGIAWSPRAPAWPAVAVGARGVSRAFDPILRLVHDAIVGRGPPAVRRADAVAQP